MASTNGTTRTIDADPTAEAGRWVSLQEAATELGISRDSVRPRVAARVLRAERRRTVRGPRLFVWIPAEGVPDLVDGDGEGPELEPAGESPAHDAAPRGVAAAHSGTTAARGAADAARGGDSRRHDAPSGAALAATRAEEMARYTAVLLEPWRRRVEEQAERLGRLEERAEHLQAEREAARAELEQARARIAELEAPPAPESPSAPAPEPGERRWWQRLLWG
jgi:hypothetical protein